MISILSPGFNRVGKYIKGANEIQALTRSWPKFWNDTLIKRARTISSRNLAVSCSYKLHSKVKVYEARFQALS